MGETVATALLAFSVVFTAMAVLTAGVYLARWASRRTLARGTAGSPPPETDPETLALLAAAACAALEKPVRVHRVHLHQGPAVETWTRAGRMDILLSHQKVGRHQ
jgi:hypothetical protein